jgi:hypothetical protein
MTSCASNLSKCQELAKGAIQSWLVNPKQKAFILRGGPGVGKSYVVNNVIQNLDEITNMQKLLGVNEHLHDILFTATTNKAASVVGGATIYSTLGISIYNDFKTGETKLNLRNATEVYSSLVIIDESSMLDKTILDTILKLTDGSCKVLFVLDGDQLPPVNSSNIPVLDLGLPEIEMTTQMRQDPNSHLYKTILDVKGWVRGGSRPDILAGPDVEYIDDVGLTDFINNMTDNDKILAYTNDCCINLNQYVRQLKSIPLGFFQEGEHVISCTTIPNKKGTFIYTDKEYIIDNISACMSYHGLFNYRECTLNGHRSLVPEDPMVFRSILNQYKSKKDWKTYFYLKENFVDVRDAYAITTHKSQGSTYDNVLINLANFNRCPDKAMLARLLYVALSRARYKVYLYGTLK